MKKVSVLMTAYNAEKYLGDAIDSVICQTYKNWELILVDNGSTDKTSSVVNEYHDERVKKILLTENIGRTAALNYALTISVGEYVAILDADDYSSPERFEVQVEYLDKNLEVGLVATTAEVIDNNGKLMGRTIGKMVRDARDTLPWCNPLVHSSIMFRKSVADRVGGYPKFLIWAQDYGFYIAVSRIAKIHVIEKNITFWRKNCIGMTSALKYNPLRNEELLACYTMAINILKPQGTSYKLCQASQALTCMSIFLSLFIRLEFRSSYAFFILFCLKFNLYGVALRLYKFYEK